MALYFTIQVYDCTQCPEADNEDGTCLFWLNQQRSINGHHTAEDYHHAEQLYNDNCSELTTNCPRL